MDELAIPIAVEAPAPSIDEHSALTSGSGKGMIRRDRGRPSAP